ARYVRGRARVVMVVCPGVFRALHDIRDVYMSRASRESALPGIIGPIPMQTTRDASLPTAYSEALDALSLGPLWTALNVLLPNERVTSAVPHRWRWRDLRPLLLEAARLVPIAEAERRVLVLRNPGLGGAYAVTSTLF